MQNSKTPGQSDGRKDGQILFYRTLPVTAGGPTKTNKQCPIKEGLKDHVTDMNNQQLQGC